MTPYWQSHATPPEPAPAVRRVVVLDGPHAHTRIVYIGTVAHLARYRRGGWQSGKLTAVTLAELVRMLQEVNECQLTP